MLDLRFLRANFEEVKQKLQHRGEDLTDFERFEQLDRRRRELIAQAEELKNKRNDVSQQIALLKREKKTRIISLLKCARLVIELKYLMMNCAK